MNGIFLFYLGFNYRIGAVASFPDYDNCVISSTKITGTKLFHVNTATTLWEQGRSGQSTLSDDPAILSNDPALQAPARSTPERGQRVGGSSSSSRWWLLLVGLIAAGLCVPFFRTVYGMGDEGVLLNGAERMLRGSRLYADFFEFLPPGGFVLTEAWFSIAGISVGSARSLAILTIVGIACFTYLACRQASNNAPLSAALATGWVVMSQGVLDASQPSLVHDTVFDGGRLGRPRQRRACAALAAVGADRGCSGWHGDDGYSEPRCTCHAGRHNRILESRGGNGRS